VSAITRRFTPYLAGGLAAAACCLLAGCGTAQAAPVAHTAATSPIAVASTAASPSASAAASASASVSASASPSAAASSAAPSKAATTPAATPSTTQPSTSAAPAQNDTLAAENAALKAQGVPCDATASACVSLSKQEAWLLRDGKVVYGPVKVATGRASLPTPAGDFKVYYKVVDGWSATYDAPMPYSVFFYEGDAFHEDPVTVRSHGCVHLSLTNAKYFYSFLQIGAKVEVRN
jgi:lipoprotein-anchoring transpeptidase ErfK/SrfK